MGFPHWNNTFGKLHIFDLVDFDKIVYLDSDLLLLANIDSLFRQPHMSAVVAGKSFPGQTDWVDLNSGLMVVEPEMGLLDDLINAIPDAAARRANMGDQDLLQEFYGDWPSTPELHLDEGYNIFNNNIDHYIRREGYGFRGKKKTIYAVHFVAGKKPWMRAGLGSLGHFMVLAGKGRINELRVSALCRVLLAKVNWRLRLGR